MNHINLRETVSVLLQRIEVFLTFAEDLENLPPGSYPEDNYLRLLVPISEPIERLHSTFGIMDAETASGVALLHGEENDESRGVALLKTTMQQYWPLPIVAGAVGAVIVNRFNVPLLVERFSAIRSRLVRVQQLLSGTQTDQRTYTSDAIPKSLLCNALGITDDEFQSRVTECPSLIHPSHGKRDRNVMFDVDALINTELYNPSLRAAAILKWKGKSTSKR